MPKLYSRLQHWTGLIFIQISFHCISLFHTLPSPYLWPCAWIDEEIDRDGAILIIGCFRFMNNACFIHYQMGIIFFIEYLPTTMPLDCFAAVFAAAGISLSGWFRLASILATLLVFVLVPFLSCFAFCQCCFYVVVFYKKQINGLIFSKHEFLSFPIRYSALTRLKRNFYSYTKLNAECLAHWTFIFLVRAAIPTKWRWWWW